MNQTRRTTAEFLWYPLIAVLYSAIIFFAAFLTPSSPTEQVVWKYSLEKLILVIILFVPFLLSVLCLLLRKTKLVSAALSRFLSSRVVHVLSILLVMGSLIYLTCSFAGGFGKYTQISQHLFPIVILISFFSSETFIFQIVHTEEKIGGKTWSNLSSIKLSKEDKLVLLAILATIGFVAAVIVNYYRGYYQYQPYPYNTFLFEIDDKFEDFSVVVGETIGMNPYENFLSGQYPFTLLVGSIFSSFSNNIGYLLFVVIFAFVYYIFSYQFFRLEKKPLGLLLTIIITTLSYPLLFSLDRGNFELLVFAFLLIFLYYYNKGKYLESAIFLAMASALKIYPAIFLLLFIKDKKYKEILITIGTIAGLTLASLLFFKGGIWKNLQYLLNFSNISNNWVFNSFLSIDKDTLVQRGVSLLTFIKIIVHQMDIPLPVFISQNFLSLYYILVAIIFLPIAYYVVFVEKVLWKNVTLLTVSMLLLPTLSADYKLMHMYLPLFMFVNARESNRMDIVYLISFAILLIPKNYFFLQNVVSDASECHDISLAVTTNIAVLILFIFTIMIPGLIDRIKSKSKAKPLNLNAQ